MKQHSLKKHISSVIYKLLKEQAEEQQPKEAEKEKPKEAEKEKPEAKKAEIKIAQGAVGRGSFRKFVREAGARSTQEPKRLMKDLGVESASSGSDLDQIEKILQTAVNFHPAMRDAYAGATARSESIPKLGNVEGVVVNLAGIDARNGMKFILHTLHAAKNAGMLKLKGPVEIGKGVKAPIFIYSP